MSALLAMVKAVPAWYWGLLLAVLLVAGIEMDGQRRGAARVQQVFDQYVQKEKDAANAAIDLRREQNKAQANEQALKSAQIQKDHDDEMAKVRADLRSSERLRLGAAWCDGGRPAGTAEAGGAGGGNEADPASGVLSPEMDGAVKSLILEMEEATATGRAAQEFIRANGGI